MDWVTEGSRRKKRIFKKKRRIKVRQRGGNKGNIKPTCGVDEGRVELLGQKRVGHVPEELLQQRSHIVNAVLLIQLDVDAAIKLLT